jgi:hypothetical protein
MNIFEALAILESAVLECKKRNVNTPGTMASSFSLTGIVLGSTVDRRWYLLPTVVLSFLLLHAIQGWCPPLAILRTLGIRTREEIARERYALKALAGDFAGISREPSRVEQTLAAVK